MNPYALAALVCLGVLATSLVLAAVARAVDAILQPRDRYVFAACSFAAGFGVAVFAFYLRT